MRFEIKDGVLMKCHAPLLGRTVTVPRQVTVIGKRAFTDCQRITAVYLPDRLTAIEEQAFFCCHNLRTVVPVQQKGLVGAVMPEGLTHIGKSAFQECRSLPSVTLPSTIKQIDDMAFLDCRSLTTFVLPDTIESMGRFMLYNCFNVRFRIPGDCTGGLFWSELTLVICRRDGKRFYFPIQHDEINTAGNHENVLHLLIKKNLYANIPREVRCKFVFRMLENGYLTEEDILSDTEAFLYSIINDDNTDAMKILLRSGMALRKLPAEVYEELLLYTNKHNQFDMQVLVMEAMKTYSREDMMERFQL